MPKKHSAPSLAEGVQHCLALLRSAQPEAMERAADELARSFPSAATAWQMLGVARLLCGDAVRAIEPLERAGTLVPGNAEVWDNLGAAFNATQAFERAAACYEKSLQLAPRNAKAWSNAAANASEAGRDQDAHAYASRAVQLDPTLAHAHLALGNALLGLGRNSEALAALREATRLAPGLAQAYLSLGSALMQSGDMQAAITATQQALTLQPRYAEAHLALGRLHSNLGGMREAARHCRAAADLQPHRLEAWSGWLYCLSHDEQISPAALFAAHREFGEHVERGWRGHWGGWKCSRVADRRLRVGFVSADLCEHPVAHFIEPVWRAFDRAAVEIIVYSTNPAEDARSAELKTLVDAWQDVSALSNDALTALIREQGIDILIDLAGHTGGHRLGVFARKPAPIQVTWLGYPNTTGLTAIDYRLVSRLGVPPDMLDEFFTEKLVRLPSGYPFRPPDDAPAVNPLPALGHGRFTFASFNRPGKLSEAGVALWCRVLHAVPDARMLIGAVPDDAVRAGLIARFAAHGIAADRLALHPRLPMREYLALHHQVDAMLDTFPYTGGTTTNLALWMGVPTLTLTGNTLPQRQGAGVLARAGLSEWIAASEADFVTRAVDIAHRPEQLATLRATLRERLLASLDETASGGRAVEAALRGMWVRWCAGEAAQRFEVGV